MRIVINGPPKQGNRWLKCLLASTYGLHVLGGSKTPDTRPKTFAAWVKSGGFPDSTIFHQHARYTKDLCDAIDAAPAHLVTIIRDPYDAFVSLFYWVQDRAANEPEREKRRPRDAIIGKPLDHPDVLAYLADGFGENLIRADAWIHSGRSLVARYEDLSRDTLGELRRVTGQIAPVADDRLEQAVESCRADNLRQRTEKWSRHIRSGTVGDSRARLTEDHLAIFRERYGPLVESLGYEVR